MDDILRRWDDTLYVITKEDLQEEAMERQGKPLTFYELEIARKGLESAFNTGIDIVIDAIFDMIEENRSNEKK